MRRIARVLTYSSLTLAGLVACAAVAPAPEPTAAPAPAEVAEAANSGAAPAAEPTPKAAPAPVVNSDLDAELMYELLVAEISFRVVDPQGAATYMLDLARQYDDGELFKRAAQMAIQSRSGALAVEATRDWREAHPDSIEAIRYQLQVLLALGRIAESGKPLKALVGALPSSERTSFIIALPALYQGAPDKNVAASAVEGALIDALQSPETGAVAWTTIGRMRLAAGDETGALSAATLAQDSDVDSQWPALLALQLFSGDQNEAAEPLILRYLAQPGANTEVRVGYARALADQGRQADARAELRMVLQSQPDHLEAWLVQGLIYADEKRDDEARQALTHYLELAQRQGATSSHEASVDISQARLALARIAERRGDYAEAEKLLSQVDSTDQILAVQLQRAQLLARQGQLEEARKIIEAVPERTPDDARLKLIAVAQLLRENGAPQQAYDLLAAALKSDPDDEGLIYDTAMAAERIGRVAEMERLLRRVIALKPDAAYAYNALGYSLADRGLRLEEARQLIEKAVQLAPRDQYIQDSLGWVEFRLGNLAKARAILQAAYDQQRDAEIAAHLGEVLWALGERDQAEAVWQQGLQDDARNQVLIQTMQRLRPAP